MLILSHNYYFLQKCFTVHIRQSDTYSRMPSVNCCIYQQAEWVDWEEEVKNKTPFIFFFFCLSPEIFGRRDGRIEIKPYPPPARLTFDLPISVLHVDHFTPPHFPSPKKRSFLHFLFLIRCLAEWNLRVLINELPNGLTSDVRRGIKTRTGNK